MGEVTTQQSANGLIVRDGNGRFLPGTRPNNVITSDIARNYVKSRWQRKAEAFEAGIAQAIKEAGLLPPGQEHPAGAWQVIGNKAATLLLDETNARNFASLLHEVRATVQDKDTDQAQAATIGGLAGGMLTAFLTVIQAAKDNASVMCSYHNQDIDSNVLDAEAADQDDEG